MAATDRITMTMRELDRFKVIQSVVDGLLKPWRAAERLSLTTRQLQPMYYRGRMPRQRCLRSWLSRVRSVRTAPRRS
jgi:hypothetical protein